MDKVLEIKSEKTLSFSGLVNGYGDKIASVHLLLASTMMTNNLRIRNLAKCEDVQSLKAWLNKSLNFDFKSEDGYFETLVIDHNNKIDLTKISHIRGSICLTSACMLKYGSVSFFSNVGGCNFTNRPIGKHLELLFAFGGNLNQVDQLFTFTLEKIPQQIEFDCSTNFGQSVGVTCHALIASLIYNNTMILNNCALEPAVQTLVDLLRSVDNRKIVQTGRSIYLGPATKTENAHKNIQVNVPYDYTIITTYVCAGIACGKADIVFQDVHRIPLFMKKLLKNLGVFYENTEPGIRIRVNQKDLRHPGYLMCEPWPGLPTDVGPVVAAALCCFPGVTTIFDTVYDKRLSHVSILDEMGYKISGIGQLTQISGKHNMIKKSLNVKVPDIRAGAAAIIGAVGRRGVAILENCQQIFRGYENIVNDFQKLGISIEIKNS
ncbi:MAG: hypothetical protein WC264_01035 [Candidatus Paceibacterota bacterium]|jgi:UDP-N-acetylglucosamine 1-carboxyvinyltransferase